MCSFVLLCQPDDHGLIGDVPVLRVTRQGPDAIHFVCSALEPGQEVQLKVDWDRRFDHMQQHSGQVCSEDEAVNCNDCRMLVVNCKCSLLLGQHLITALADTMFGYKTTSWYSGNAQCGFLFYVYYCSLLQ